jgi:glyoxylase-like metal-dependent hydrolase (beta-lactamase superfamily II)
MNLLKTHGPYYYNEWKVTRIVEWEGEAMPHPVLFPGKTAGEIRAASPPGAEGRLTENGMIVTSTQLFVMQAGGRAVVIEAGSGNGKTRPAEPYWDHQNLPYRETLGSLGIEAEDVAYVFLSHLHPDHVGLATTGENGRWTPTFPRAKYVLHPREWEYWTSRSRDDPGSHPFIDDSVLPLMDSGCVLFAREGERIGGIRIHETPGHTPGHLIFEAGEGELWLLGDLLHHPAQVAHPEWPSGDWDTDREGAVSQRRKFFTRFAESAAPLLAAHTGGLFRIEETGPGRFFFRYEKSQTAEECPPGAVSVSY